MAIKTLIIEDQDSVAAAIDHQLRDTGDYFTHQSRTAANALDRINAARATPYDLVLCDYNLGAATNGQQLLEYLRTDRHMPYRTAFIMLTAEAAYGAVASAVELIPDAYVIKPFTQEILMSRVQHAMQKRDALMPVYHHLDQPIPDYPAALSACNTLILNSNRYVLEVLKLKADILMRQKQWSEASHVYDKILAWRSVPWAQVGMARVLRLMDYPDKAKLRLDQALADFPMYVAAYDEVAALKEAEGDLAAAQAVLEKAHSIVPSSRRSRTIGLMALDNANPEKACDYLRVVIDRERYGLTRSTEDFFGLATCYRVLGRLADAQATIDSISQFFPETRPLKARKLAASALVHAAAGRPYDARRLVEEALSYLDLSTEPRTQLEVAEASVACGDNAEADRLFKHVAENWQEQSRVLALVRQTVLRSGRGEEGLTRVDSSLRELARLNNEAIEMMQNHYLDKAVEKLALVAERLPNHAMVQANFVQALLLVVEDEAPANIDELPPQAKVRRRLDTARKHLKKLVALDEQHPRLRELQRQFACFTGETDIAEQAMMEFVHTELASMEVTV